MEEANSRWKRPLKWAGAIGLGAAMVLAGLFAFTQTGPGKALIASRVSALLSNSERSVSIGKIEGFIPFDMRIGQVSVADADGIWLRVDDAALRLSPWPLLRGRLHLEELLIASLRIDRFPSKPAGEEPAKLEIPTLPTEKLPVEIERFVIRDFFLGQDAVGQNALFRVEAGMGVTGNGGHKTFLHLERTDGGPETSAHFSIVSETARPEVKVEGAFREAPEGVVAGLLGLHPGPLYLEVIGSGPVSDWKGSVQGSAGRYGTLTTKVVLKSDGETNLSLDGEVQISEHLVSEKLAPVLGGGNFFGLRVSSSSKHFRIEDARLRGKAYQGRLSGRFDRESEAIEGQWAFEFDHPVAREARAEAPREEFRASGAVSGKLRRPEGTLSLAVKNFKTGGVAFEQILTEIEFKPLEVIPSRAWGFQINGNTSGKGLNIPGRPAMSNRSFSWLVEIEAPKAGNPVEVKVRAGQEPDVFLLEAQIDTAGKTGALNASLRIENLNSIGALTGNELPGNPSLKLDLSGKMSAGSGAGKFEGEIGDIQAGGGPVAALFSCKTSFSGEYDIKGTEAVLSALRIESPQLKFEANGAADFSKNEMRGEWHLRVPQVAGPARAAGVDASGSIEAGGTVAGKFTSLEHHASLETSDLVMNGRNLPKIAADLKAREIPEKPSGDIQIEIRREGEKLSASTDFIFRERELTLPKLKIAAPGGEFTGNLAVDFGNETAVGRIEGGFTSLAAIGRITGEPLAGRVKFQVDLKRGRKGLDVQGTLSANDFSTRFGEVKQVNLSAEISDALANPRGNLSLDAREFHGAGAELEKLGLKFSGSEKGLDFESSGKGKYHEGFDFRVQGDFTRPKGSDQLRVSLLSGSYGNRRFRLTEPLAVRRSEGRTSFDRFTLSIGRGSVSASGLFDSGRVALSADFENLPFETPATAEAYRLSATASGKLKVEGAPSKPSASLSGRLTDIRPAEPLGKEPDAPALDLEVRLADGRLRATAQMSGSSANEYIKADLSTAAAFSLLPFALALPPSGGLEGTIEGKTNLARISSLVPLRGHEISGPANGNFTLEGTLASPRISGTLRVENGLYQNLEYGSVLKDLTIVLSARGTRLEIESMRATDGDKGVLTGEGHLNVDPASGFPLDIKVNMSNMTLVRLENATGTLNGTVAVSGPAAKMAIRGQLEVKTAEMLLKPVPPRSVVHLDVIEIHGGQRAATKAEEEKAAASPINPQIDIKISIPGNAYVRGRGLDSEWKGNISLAGQAGHQTVTGTLNTIRGTFDFLGKRFTITSGIIRFYGAVPPAPTIDVTAESSAQNITARLLLQGAVSGPDIKLESDPPLPSDEILSRVLFNRAAGSLTPIQALRLADALRSLSGRGHMLDFLGRTREFLGLGQLEFREMEKDQGTGLGIGRYLSEEVYVDVEKGIGNDTGKASVRVELTPNITLEAEAGLNSRHGLGLQWKHDY